MKQLLLLSTLFGVLVLSAQTDVEKAEETVKKSSVEGHIYFLADDLLKGRDTGTQENKIAASYLANTLRSYGVKPNPVSGNYYQKMDLFQFALQEKIKLSLNGVNFPEVVAFDIDSVKSEENAIYLNYGLESDYKNKDVKDKIIIARAGTPGSTDMRSAFGNRAPKRELAIKHGAKGLIELGSFDPKQWPRFKHSFKERISFQKAKKNLYLCIYGFRPVLNN